MDKSIEFLNGDKGNRISNITEENLKESTDFNRNSRKIKL